MPDSPTSDAPRLSFVFPCLNEEKTVAACVTQVSRSLGELGIPYEIILADNGSTDRSPEIATSLGARVVPVAERGYGAAIRGGIAAARGEHVMFADCDNTYLYEDAGRLYEKALETGADMAIASRMTGAIEPGAMPPLHRWLGTPVLTGIINVLFRGRLTDCNSGFRCMRKSSFESWRIRSNGMEFASELLIKALKAGARMVEVPSGLRKGPEGRVAHLRTWRDGMRHLLFIFSEKPGLFEVVGLACLLAATALQLLTLVTGPVALFGTFHVFDLHSQLLLFLAGVAGAQFYLFSCMLHLHGDTRPLRLTRRLIHLDEGVLFFSLLTSLFLGLGAIGYLLTRWTLSSFSNLNLAHQLLPVFHLLAVVIVFTCGMLGLHIMKKARS